MNVLLDTLRLHSGNEIRGVGVYARFLSKSLEKLENDSQHFFSSEDIGFEQLNAYIDKNHIDIIHYPYFDLFQQTLPFAFMSQLLGRAKQKSVVTIHDVIPLRYPEGYPVGIKGSVGLFLQKTNLQSVNAVITDSQTSKRDIIQYLGYPENKITVVPLAGNPEIKQSSASQIKAVIKTYNLPDKYLLYVGDINYNKNIPELLKALRQLSDIHLVCVGVNFKPQPIPEWQAIERELGAVKDRVHFLTGIAKDDNTTLSALYTGASAYVQPSLYEGFGLPLLEAMQCGTLVVSSNTPALREIGGDVTMFVDPTAQGFADGIKQVLQLSDSEKMRRQKNGLAQAASYSWDMVAKQTIAVYKSVL